ncbi:DUF5343 domain-containing protein [uncultured Parasphingorhabdus sp.]|uniref:DUF5343 domain-containing protein n=1 Tax=uncultured Parasphingorhabdus sp. TaxID=2709694 RepID=UPI0030D78A12
MSFPYLPSAGIFQQAVDQFRKSIPSTVDAATLKKLGIAPSNEGYIINTLKFLGVVDVENNRTDKGHDLFTTHDDSEFQKGLASIAKEKYSELFDIRGDEAWKLDRDALISFFRTSDKTSEIVGKRQAIAFIAIASIAGQRDEEIQTRKTRTRKGIAPAAQKAEKSGTKAVKPAIQTPIPSAPNSSDVGLTVRIEINLPANGSQATYDNIFQSIRKNLFP